MSLGLFLCLLAASVQGQFGRRALPPPLRVFVPFETVWEAIQRVLEEREFSAAEADRGNGLIVTEFREFISGPLTSGRLAAIADRARAGDGDWVRVIVQYEIQVELVEFRNTLVTVDTNIRALKRNFLGTESWHDLPSNGTLEGDLLTEFGRYLFGEAFILDRPRKGYWQREPQYAPDQQRPPRGIGPERPPRR